MVKYSADEVFSALAHPVRRQIVERLSGNRKASLSELARPFSLSLPAMMRHADVLEKSGIVVSSKEGRVRYYAINIESLAAGMSWFRTMERAWEGRFERLAHHLKNK